MRSFEVAARLSSFTDAARELHMTQAGVSQHIRNLELHLGEPLFHRLPRSVQLTDAGEAFLHVVREAFDRMESGIGEIFGSREEGPVTLRVNVAFATLWLAPRLPVFQALHPGIGLRLIAAVHGSDTAWDGVDLEIRYGAARAPGLNVLPLGRDELFPVCAPELLERRPPLRRPRDLAACTLIHVIGNRYGWSDWFQAAGVAEAPTAASLQTDTSALALALAAAGAGVALGHRSLVTDYVGDGRLVAPFETRLPAEPVFHLVMPRGRPPRPDARVLRDWLFETAHDRTLDAAQVAAQATAQAAAS
jgi:LysR family glycine cleavage system transcriptional activator